MAVMESWTQTTFRYRDDDGSETGATWRQIAGTNDTLSVDTNYRMRFLITGAHTGGSGSFDFTGGFQYQNTTKATGWVNITTTSSHVKAVASADTSWTINDDDATTEQLAGGATFVAGHMDETGACSAVSLSETQESEFELVFQIVSADVDNADTIEIRMVDSGTALATYTATPSITVSEGGGTNTDIPVPIGAATAAGLVPTVSEDIVISPDVGAATITGYAPARGTGLRLVGYAPQVFNNVGGDLTVPVPVGSITATGLGPTLDLNIALPTGSATITGYAPEALVNVNIEVPAGSAATQGLAPTLDVTISVPAGSATLSGLAPTLDTGVLIPAGAIAATGYVPTVRQDIFIDVPAGAITSQGYAPTLDLAIGVPAGALTATGYAAFIPGDSTITVPLGSVTSQGYGPTLDLTIVTPAGAATITGHAPSVLIDVTVAPGTGAITSQGYAPTLDTAVAVGTGSVTSQGYDPTADIGTGSPIIPVPAGSLVITGYTPTVVNTSAVATAQTGRSRRRRYYSVEVDGEIFVFATVADVENFLATVREQAEEQAEQIITSKPPVIRVRTAKGKASTSKTVQAAVKRTRKAVNKAYTKAAKSREIDTEISRLILAKLEREAADEDNVIALLLMG